MGCPTVKSSNGKYEGILHRAAAEEYGLIMRTDNPTVLRARLYPIYSARRGILGELSFFVLPGPAGIYELFIMRKEAISAPS